MKNLAETIIISLFVITVCILSSVISDKTKKIKSLETDNEDYQKQVAEYKAVLNYMNKGVSNHFFTVHGTNLPVLKYRSNVGFEGETNK
jgi:hypothetical protein